MLFKISNVVYGLVVQSIERPICGLGCRGFEPEPGLVVSNKNALQDCFKWRGHQLRATNSLYSVRNQETLSGELAVVV